MHRVFYVLMVPVWLVGATANNLVDEPLAAVGDSTNQHYFNDGNSEIYHFFPHNYTQLLMTASLYFFSYIHDASKNHS